MTTITNPTMEQLEAIAAQANNSKPVIAEAPPVEKVELVDRSKEQLIEEVEALRTALKKILIADHDTAVRVAQSALNEQPLPVVWPSGFTTRDLLQKHFVDLYENYDLTSKESSGWKYNGEVAKAAIKAGWFNEPAGPEFVDTMKAKPVRALAEAILSTLRNEAVSPN